MRRQVVQQGRKIVKHHHRENERMAQTLGRAREGAAAGWEVGGSGCRQRRQPGHLGSSHGADWEAPPAI